MKGLAAQLVHRTQQLPQAKPWNDPHKPTANIHAKHSVPQYSYQMGPHLQQTIAFPHHAGASILQPVSAANAATSSDRKRTPRRTVRELVCRERGAQGIVCTKVAHSRGGRGNPHGALVSMSTGLIPTALLAMRKSCHCHTPIWSHFRPTSNGAICPSNRALSPGSKIPATGLR